VTRSSALSIRSTAARAIILVALGTILLSLLSTLSLTSCESGGGRRSVVIPASGPDTAAFLDEESGDRETGSRSVGSKGSGPNQTSVTATIERLPEAGDLDPDVGSVPGETALEASGRRSVTEPAERGSAERGSSENGSAELASGDTGPGEMRYPGRAAARESSTARGRRADPIRRVVGEAAESSAAKPEGSKTPEARRVARLIERLRSGPPENEEAFLEIARVDARLIPELIPWTESKASTKFYRMETVALHDRIVRADEKDGTLYYFVKGMGRFFFDDVATGAVRGRPGATRIEYRAYESAFPLGVVIRAALLRRFASSKYPASSDDEERIADWWREYYELSKLRL
jgi:hypothetical protein